MTSRPTCGCKIDRRSPGDFAIAVDDAEKLYRLTMVKATSRITWEHATPEQRAPYVAAVLAMYSRAAQRHDTTRIPDVAPKPRLDGPVIAISALSFAAIVLSFLAFFLS